MNKRIFDFELNGERVLGFDTGLNAAAFAQAKMAQFISQPGFIVYPDERIDPWKPRGVSERELQPGGTMVVWGPLFPGEEFTDIINGAGRSDEALDALRFWIRARLLVEKKLAAGDRETDGLPHNEADAPFAGPAGAFIVTKTKQGSYPAGTVFFPPTRLLKRSLEAGDGAAEEAAIWIHPDLYGPEEISFSAGAILYRVMSGTPPFAVKSPPLPAGTAETGEAQAAEPKDRGSPADELREDIREAVYVPPRLAAPGIDPEMAALITRAMISVNQSREEKRKLPSLRQDTAGRPSPDFIAAFIGPAYSKPVSSWLRSLSEEEIAKIRGAEEQHRKQKALTVKTRRFVIRNTAIIMTSLAVALSAVLIIRGWIKHRAELPTTLGLSPAQVVETYYGAFGEMDHTLMEACVNGRAGKGDIEMVVNVFVTSRMRQAYETILDAQMSAQKWLDAGKPATERMVFGVTNLETQTVSAGDEETLIDAEYILWMPGSYLAEETAITEEPEPGEAALPPAPLPPGGLEGKDRITLTFRKDRWLISEIERSTGGVIH